MSWLSCLHSQGKGIHSCHILFWSLPGLLMMCEHDRKAPISISLWAKSSALRGLSQGCTSLNGLPDRRALEPSQDEISYPGGEGGDSRISSWSVCPEAQRASSWGAGVAHKYAITGDCFLGANPWWGPPQTQPAACQHHRVKLGSSLEIQMDGPQARLGGPCVWTISLGGSSHFLLHNEALQIQGFKATQSYYGLYG